MKLSGKFFLYILVTLFIAYKKYLENCIINIKTSSIKLILIKTELDCVTYIFILNIGLRNFYVGEDD